MTNEEIMQDLQLYVFRDKPAALLTELQGKVDKAEKDNIDMAVYTAALKKVQAAYDAAHYYYNFLVDTFMDVDYSIETSEVYFEYTVNEIELILKSLTIVEYHEHK